MASAVAAANSSGSKALGGETLTERSKGRDVRNSNIIAAKVRTYTLQSDSISVGQAGMQATVTW